MSDLTASTAGPVLPGDAAEIWGTFRSTEALEAAIARLTSSGFDRADLSLPDLTLNPAHRTPEQGAANPNTQEDEQQMRTLHASMAGSVGALLGAGLVIGTGGAALPAVAAAAVLGLGAGAAVHQAEAVADSTEQHQRQDAAAEGRLVLSVRLKSPALRDVALAALRDAGAAQVQEVLRHSGAATDVRPA